MNRSLSVPVLVALAAGCATGGTAARVATISLPPCTVPSAGAKWHQVSADGMTFCLPEGWTSVGAQEWHGADESIRWGRGEMRVPYVTPVPVTERSTWGRVSNPTPPISVFHSVETVGGAQVALWITRDGGYHTGAEWTTGKRMYMAGTARTLDAAERQIDIFRTGRMTGQ